MVAESRMLKCLSLLVFGPAAFLAGFSLGGGFETSNSSATNALTTSSAIASSDTATTSTTAVPVSDPTALLPVSNNNNNNNNININSNNNDPVVTSPVVTPGGSDNNPVNSDNYQSPVSAPPRPVSAPPPPSPSPPPPPQQTAVSTPTPVAAPPPEIPSVPWSTTNTLESGPLVGHTTHDSTKLWAFQGKSSTKPMEIVYRRSRDGVAGRLQNIPANNIHLVDIDGLEASTLYTYEVRIENERVAEGRFQTAPLPHRPVQFDYLLASCMNVRSHNGYPEQPVWDKILSLQQQQKGKPLDFALLPGDTVYLNDQDWAEGTGEILYDRVWFRNMEQRSERHFANFIKQVPTYSVWDDHDYGSNNSDRHQPGKENSLKAFSDLWPNPPYGTPQQQASGIFFSFHWGNVQFIVMDNHWYRDKNVGTQFGTVQKEWLFRQLRASTAVFKVIVTGSDVMERNMSVDVADIGKVVTENRISGVLFHAGDIHRNEFKARNYDGVWPYKVTQITSSGIARVWRRPFAMIHVDTERNDPEMKVSFYAADNESTDTTWSNDPNQRCRDLESVTEHHRCTETVRLSDLTP